MKYHRLSTSDLEEFQEEFVTFLATNGIVAADWQQMKVATPEKADELIDQFSDLVIHRSLTNISALKLVAEKEMYVFLFEEQEGKVVHLKVGAEVDRSLTDPQTLEDLASGALPLKSLKPEIAKGKKKLTGDREMEMYHLMRQGAQPCEAAFFNDFRKLCD